MGNRVSKIIQVFTFAVATVISNVSFAVFDISAPDIAENGSVVPVLISNITPPLSTGDKYVVQLPDGSVALTTTLSAGMSLSAVNTRVRLFDSGSNIVKFTIYRGDGSSESAEKEIIVTIPSSPPPDTSIGGTSVKDRASYYDGVGTIKLLFSNEMATINYIETITITSADGIIHTAATPCISRNPYFAFSGAFDPVTNPYTLEVTAATTLGSCSPANDSDSDGMPDTFELQYNFNPLDASDADTDADGDGYSNLEEYKAGTDPRDPNSVPSQAPMTWLPILLEE